MKDNMIKENKKRWDFPGATAVKALLSNCRRPSFDPWVRKIPWRSDWLPTPVFLPGEFHGQRSLAGYSPWGWSQPWLKQGQNTNKTNQEKRRKQSRDEEKYIRRKIKGKWWGEKEKEKSEGKQKFVWREVCVFVCSIVSESLWDFYHYATWEAHMAIKQCLIFFFLFLFIS